MDILDPLEKILDIAMALKDLVEIYKGKDKYFESCYTYLDSVMESVTDYKAHRDPKQKLPIACKLLQDELESFKEFLEKEKSRNSFTSFFRGSSMVNEAKELMTAIEKQIHNFNMAVIVEFKNETSDNFKRLPSSGVGGIESQLKSKFLYPEASDMWSNRFFQEEQVSWSDFAFAIKKFALDTLKIELNEVQIEQIITSIDENHDRLIRYDEWDNFYGKVWKDEEKRKEILSRPPVIIKKASTMINPLVLKVKKVNTDDPKEYRYPENHEFFISEDKVEFIDYENKGITIMRNWEKEALYVGRIKPQIYKPDIYYHNKVTSVIAEKQFQITMKTLVGQSGFYLYNLTPGNITSLAIENIPYIVEPGMIFDLSGALIMVEEMDPPLNCALKEDSPDYFYVSVQPKIEEDTKGDEPTLAAQKKKKKKASGGGEEEAPKKKAKKSAAVQSSIMFRVIEGDAEPKEQEFKAAKKGEEKVVKVGSDENCDLIIKDIEKVNVVFRFDGTLKNWVVERNEQCTNELDADGWLKTYLLLMHANDYTVKSSDKPKVGKVAAKLRDKMKIAYNYNELEVIMK